MKVETQGKGATQRTHSDEGAHALSLELYKLERIFYHLGWTKNNYAIGFRKHNTTIAQYAIYTMTLNEVA